MEALQHLFHIGAAEDGLIIRQPEQRSSDAAKEILGLSEMNSLFSCSRSASSRSRLAGSTKSAQIVSC